MIPVVEAVQSGIKRPTDSHCHDKIEKTVNLIHTIPHYTNYTAEHEKGTLHFQLHIHHHHEK
ncbi:MAG: hypothetical protein PQJ46_02170 [Spirochaetales bacterium]|nr:hypothetical protein [Spirochaetales bacterium]